MSKAFNYQHFTPYEEFCYYQDTSQELILYFPPYFYPCSSPYSSPCSSPYFCPYFSPDFSP